MSGGAGQRVGVVMENDNEKISYEVAEELLTKYYKEEYPGYNIKSICKYDSSTNDDYITFYTFYTKIIVSKEVMINGKMVKICEPLYLNNKQTEKLLKELMQKELDKEEVNLYEVIDVYPRKDGVYVAIKINTKKLVKTKGE